MEGFKKKMEKATIGSASLEIMGIVGTLRDLIDQYASWFERTYPVIGKEGIPDYEFDKVCEAFGPAITFMEDVVHERLNDFFVSLDDREI